MGAISGPGGGGVSEETGSYAGAVTGFTVPINVTVFFLLAGNLVTLMIPPFTGTSNANTLTITGAPASIRPLVNPAAAVVAFPLLNNGDQVSGTIFMDTSGVLQFRRGNSLTAWADFGTKALDGAALQYTYQRVTS